METLAPPLECLVHIKHALHSGKSIRSEIKEYCLEFEHDFSRSLRRWLVVREQGPEQARLIFRKENEYRQALIEILSFGLDGQPVLDRLNVLEQEMKRAAQIELDTHLAKVPFKMMIPLFGFIFPAFLLLILGPLIADLLSALNS